MNAKLVTRNLHAARYGRFLPLGKAYDAAQPTPAGWGTLAWARLDATQWAAKSGHTWVGSDRHGRAILHGDELNETHGEG